MDVDMLEDDDSNACSNSSNSPEPGSDDEDEIDEAAIAEIQEKISSNPYIYDPHVQLITSLRKAADLERLRKAREEMSKVFPLTPELWLDWLTDEEKLAVTDEEKESVIQLFDRAVKDYTSVSVWLEYVQYVIGLMGSDDAVAKIRKTFDKALTAVGIHVLEGSLIWDAYREFENALLNSMQTSDNDLESQKMVEAQKNKVYSLFRRQLSVPLLSMENTYKEFQELTEIDSFTEQQYQKALQILKKIKPLEDALFKSESPHLEEYKKYIEFEKSEGNPARIQCIYERALLENCLVPDLWLDYTKYLDQEIKNGEIALPVHERAVRNCPWSALCWKSYLLALERYRQPHEVVKSMFEKALNSGFTEGEDYRILWLSYLDYLRRRIDWSKRDAPELEELNSTFEKATEHMSYYKDGDSQCTILQYWAKIQAKFCKDVSSARETWAGIMNLGHHGESEMWMQYANFERLYGDEKHHRKILIKGLHSVNDWPETIGTALLNFEREEGTIESLDIATTKYEKVMQRVLEKRLKATQKEAERQEYEAQKRRMWSPKRDVRKDKFQPQKFVKAEKDIQMDSEGFKIPFAPPRGQQTPEPKADQVKAHDSQERRKRPAEFEESESKRKRVEENKHHGMSIKHDPSNDPKSVFLSNLSYDVGEEKIKETFSSVGDIQEVRLVKDYKGRSKGFCYIVFSTQEEAVKALEKDREFIDGRPVFVSACEDKKHSASAASSQPKFKFGTGLEKNKLFVKGLPFTTTKEELETIFKEFGTLKDVRVVTYRNGHSKGIAFVEYENETSASTAVVKTDGLKIGEHTISVAISNPPERKPRWDSRSHFEPLSTHLGGGGSTENGPRGRGRTQLSLLPRALQKPTVHQKPPSTIPESAVQNGATKPSDNKKLSNDDFRSMLLKK